MIRWFWSTGEYMVELFHAKDGWHWRIRHKNGNILSTSESYASIDGARGTAARLARDAGWEISEPK